MPTASKATLVGDMGSLGQASNKLIRQFNFPLQYDDYEQMLQADHDRMFMWDYQHTRDAFKHYMDTGELGLPAWACRVSNEHVMALLKDLFKVKETYPEVEWTGYRITGTVNCSDGHSVFSLWLFAKKKGSKTKVYSGDLFSQVGRKKIFPDDFMEKKKRGVSSQTARSSQ